MDNSTGVAQADRDGALDGPLDDASTVVVHHWIVTGEPGPIGPPELDNGRFPSYRFVYSSADRRWPDHYAEHTARSFIDRVTAGAPGLGDFGHWEDGPHLHHRVVTYGPLEEVL